MNVTTLKSGSEVEFSLVGKCPHCLRESVCTMVTKPYAEILGTGHSDASAPKRFSAVTQCQGCRKYVLAIVTRAAAQQQGQNSTHPLVYEAHYPLDKPDESVAEEIPEKIREDFKEALRCLWVKAYNATAEMCRRAVEGSCIELGAHRKKSLEQKIDWVAQQGKITAFLAQVAHKIRLGGNLAAHNFPQAQPSDATETNKTGIPDEEVKLPSDEPNISADQAEAIVKFTREYFHHVYVVPKELSKYDFSDSRAKTAAPSKP